VARGLAPLNLSQRPRTFSGMEQIKRWCPVCEDPGVPIVWGYPTVRDQQLAKEGQVILAGCDVTGTHQTHECGTCGCEFIASSRLYLRHGAQGEIYGVAVWPHGRRSVRVEANEDGFTVMIEREGSMLIGRQDMTVACNEVFTDMWPWDVQRWATRRGFAAKVSADDNGWSLNVRGDLVSFELLLIKAWWRDLGRSSVRTAIERLTQENSSPVWLPTEKSETA
jgi:hypothetical protein